MDHRKIIDEKILISIPIKVKSYKNDIYWRDILDIEGIQLDDKVHDIIWKKEEQINFGSEDIENEDNIVMVPKLFVTRKRKETDKEYLDRKRIEENQNKINEERDKLEYLRLKAKFEK